MNTKQKFIQQYEIITERENRASVFKSDTRQVEEDKRKLGMLDALQDLLGIKSDKVHTNGFWYHFEYKGKFVSLVDQSSRTLIEAYVTPRDDAREKACFAYYIHMHHFLEHEGRQSEWDEFAVHFEWEHYTIEPDPTPHEVVSQVESLVHEAREYTKM